MARKVIKTTTLEDGKTVVTEERKYGFGHAVFVVLVVSFVGGMIIQSPILGIVILLFVLMALGARVSAGPCANKAFSNWIERHNK